MAIIIIISVVESRFGFFPRFSSCSRGSEVIVLLKLHRDLALQEGPHQERFRQLPTEAEKTEEGWRRVLVSGTEE